MILCVNNVVLIDGKQPTLEWSMRRRMCESQTSAAGQKQLASCCLRPCLQNKPSNRRLLSSLLLQLARPCWSPRLTPFFWRSGAHESSGRQITGSLYASAKSHAGSCLSRAATLAPGTNGSGKVTTHVTMPRMKPNLASPVLSISQVANILSLEEAARQADWLK